jgi:hypothetical protein
LSNDDGTEKSIGEVWVFGLMGSDRCLESAFFCKSLIES